MTEEARREVRLALVLNGGVSLAIWIGGVTKEIDQLRLSSELDGRRDDLGPTGELYQELMAILAQQARVDVISGASAGGINGILLSSAIFSGSGLPESLREIWIGLGDFRSLLRSPSDRDPPSLMKGDQVVLGKLRETIAEIYAGSRGRKRPSEGVYLYVTATDLLGKWLTFQDTTGRAFQELDHRRVLEFTHRRGQEYSDGRPATKSRLRDVPMRADPPVYFVDGDAPELLARAGRATSSFPVAFEPHGLAFKGERPEDVPDERWLIDGGVLDNQPFNPVLDRISMLPSELPVRRVVAYIVPYVNEPEQFLREVAAEAARDESQGSADPAEPDARTVYAASGSLPRTLPKLQSIERVLREWREQAKAEGDRRLLWPVGLEDEDQMRLAREEHDRIRLAAINLLPAYRRTRYASSRRLFEGWLDESFMPGDGVSGQNPAVEPLATPRIRTAAVIEDPPSDTPWLSETLEWTQDVGWRWGLSPAERVAAWALLFLRDALRGSDPAMRDAVLEARREASQLVWDIRQLKLLLQQRFESSDADLDAIERARRAYQSLSAELLALKERFVKLNRLLAAIGEQLVPTVEDLLCLEVVRHAYDVDDPRVPFPFAFVFMSAGLGNALGHLARSPETKLGGMQAAHFGGFLKRSWRANDWLWGRLDGVQHVIRATVDLTWVAELGEKTWEELAEFAFPDSVQPDDEGAELERLWWERLERADAETGAQAAHAKASGARRSFVEFLREAAELDASEDSVDAEARQRRKLALFRCCQGALAARIQLRVLDHDLARVAEAAAEDVEAGSSRIAFGVRWAGRFYQREPDLGRGAARRLTAREQVELFTSLAIGEQEKVGDEVGSRASIELGSQAVAVATAMFAGNRGGLPMPVRAALASARGVTLAFSGLARLLAGSPAIGAALLALISALVVWGLVAPNALLGALLPALVALGIALAYVLLNFATGALEPNIDGGKRLLGAAVLIGLPLVLLAVCWDGWLGVADVWSWAHERVDPHVDGWANGIAGLFAAAAALLAAIRLALEPSIPGRARRRVLSLYRIGVVGALLALGAGFLIERWRDEPVAEGACNPTDPCSGTDWATVADERTGLILFAVLLGTTLLAAILVETVIPIWKRSWEWLRRSRSKKKARDAAV